MNEALDLLLTPLLASVALVAIHCQFGLQVLRRNVVFVDLALAQWAALGATIAFMQGHMPQSTAAYGWSLGFAWLAALMLSSLRYLPRRISHEAIVGVLYVAAAAAGLILVEKAPQGAEHLKQILTGSILTVREEELSQALAVYLPVGALLWVATRRGWFGRRGLAGWLAELGFYACFGVVVTSSVALAGVLLVFCFLIIPAMMGVLWARSHAGQFLVGWLSGSVASGAGLIVSYQFDTSTGATLVCTFALALAVALALRLLKEKGWGIAEMTVALGGVTAVVILASILWLVAMPRADQPVLDAAEAVWPKLRQLYFNRRESEIYAEAERYAARYAAEAARLSALEAQARLNDSPVEDELIRKISSFQQSYNEMSKGERFVMAETRARARERLRWPLGALAAGTGAAMLAYHLRSRRAKKRRSSYESKSPVTA